MIYLADTADIDELKKLFYYFPLEGITTNPTIIAQAGKKLSVIMPELIEVVQDKMLHVQMISSRAEDMLREAKAYKAKYGLGDNYYAKIPVTEEGYKAMPMIKEAGINVTATAIFTQQQALVAARAGADWVAPYVNRLDNISSHGIEVVGNIVENIERFNLPTKVLAASFKTVDQVHRVSMMGSQAATVNFEILERLRSHPMTDMSVEWFEKDADGLYDIDF
ncbi:fructose-6-phosphate aldolase [Carboxylicivirga mesophila]|uniref:Fructose-6-phosphate aldolase n=1 Tax=Carboxylicivirga mesophila TaxID=1166478 RepID=A0ABS5KCP5_9BACT|nr:transaldolase family protein [Carboxylicivirga mesophila]MBS2212704.1 fructose-6-phosphate aldolase [Carboxylicivirga mesophila]